MSFTKWTLISPETAMANELLKEIVQREKALAAEVAAEKERARAWLEGVRSELEIDAEQRRQTLQQQGASVQAAALAAEKTAAEERLRQAEALTQRFAALSDEQLQMLIRAKLATILPARGHDHPDVEG